MALALRLPLVCQHTLPLHLMAPLRPHLSQLHEQLHHHLQMMLAWLQLALTPALELQPLRVRALVLHAWKPHQPERLCVALPSLE